MYRQNHKNVKPGCIYEGLQDLSARPHLVSAHLGSRRGILFKVRDLIWCPTLPGREGEDSITEESHFPSPHLLFCVVVFEFLNSTILIIFITLTDVTLNIAVILINTQPPFSRNFSHPANMPYDFEISTENLSTELKIKLNLG